LSRESSGENKLVRTKKNRFDEKAQGPHKQAKAVKSGGVKVSTFLFVHYTSAVPQQKRQARGLCQLWFI
jgi:hypothetical protein